MARPPDDLVPSLLATSDVLRTGWSAAEAANVEPGSRVVVVGAGSVGLLGVFSAKLIGAERIVAVCRHESVTSLLASLERRTFVPNVGPRASLAPSI